MRGRARVQVHSWGWDEPPLEVVIPPRGEMYIMDNLKKYI